MTNYALAEVLTGHADAGALQIFEFPTTRAKLDEWLTGFGKASANASLRSSSGFAIVAAMTLALFPDGGIGVCPARG